MDNREKAWSEYKESDGFAKYSHHEFDAGFEAGIKAREEQIEKLKKEIEELRNGEYTQQVLDANKNLISYIHSNTEGVDCARCKNKSMCLLDSEFDRCENCYDYAKKKNYTSFGAYRKLYSFTPDPDFVPPSLRGIHVVQRGSTYNGWREHPIFDDVLDELRVNLIKDLQGDNKLVTIQVQLDTDKTSVYNHVYIIKGANFKRKTDGYPENIQSGLDMIDTQIKNQKRSEKERVLNTNVDKNTPLGYKEVNDL